MDYDEFKKRLPPFLGLNAVLAGSKESKEYYSKMADLLLEDNPNMRIKTQKKND